MFRGVYEYTLGSHNSLVRKMIFLETYMYTKVGICFMETNVTILVVA